MDRFKKVGSSIRSNKWIKTNTSRVDELVSSLNEIGVPSDPKHGLDEYNK